MNLAGPLLVLFITVLLLGLAVCVLASLLMDAHDRTRRLDLDLQEMKRQRDQCWGENIEYRRAATRTYFLDELEGLA